jgi:enterochelin esterase-like enzyme
MAWPKFEDDFAQLFDTHGAAYTAYGLPDYGHDWNHWRLALQDFCKRLFKPAPSSP